MHAAVNSDIQSHPVLNKHKIVFLSSFKNLVSWYIFTQVWYNRLLFKATDSCVAKTDLTPWLTSCFDQQWSAAFSTDYWETLHNWKKRSNLPYWTSNAAVLFCRNYFSGLGWIHTQTLWLPGLGWGEEPSRWGGVSLYVLTGLMSSSVGDRKTLHLVSFEEVLWSARVMSDLI